LVVVLIVGLIAALIMVMFIRYMKRKELLFIEVILSNAATYSKGAIVKVIWIGLACNAKKKQVLK